MPKDIPYASRDEIAAYMQAHLYINDVRDYTPEFQAYLDAIDCDNFTTFDVAICYRAGFTTEEASAALRKQDAEDAMEAHAMWQEEKEYYDDQRND